MAQYAFTYEQFHGYSHSRSVTSEAKGTVELSDEDVAALVKLMREKGTSDVEELKLEEVAPSIYDALYEECREIGYRTELLDSYFEGWSNDWFEYNEREFETQCKARGFKFDRKSPHSKGNQLYSWLQCYFDQVSVDEAIDFMEKYANAELEDPGCLEFDFSVVIPQAIIDMAFPSKEK